MRTGVSMVGGGGDGFLVFEGWLLRGHQTETGFDRDPLARVFVLWRESGRVCGESRLTLGIDFGQRVDALSTRVKIIHQVHLATEVAELERTPDLIEMRPTKTSASTTRGNTNLREKDNVPSSRFILRFLPKTKKGCDNDFS